MIVKDNYQPNLDLLFHNGFGGFDPKKKEYVIKLTNYNLTPLPWVNIIANPIFGSIVTEAGPSHTWFVNSRNFCLTRWINDPVTEQSGELIYLRDEDTGYVWSPTPLPIRESQEYQICHGLGYSIFEHESNEVFQHLSIFIARKLPIKFIQLTLANHSSQKKRLSVTYFTQWLLGDMIERTKSHIQTEIDYKNNLITARNPLSPDFPRHTVFLGSYNNHSAFCLDRTKFFGRNSNSPIPEALKKPALSNENIQANDPAGAIQSVIELNPGEKQVITFYLGVTDKNITDFISRFKNRKQIKKEFVSANKFWLNTLSAININTPNQTLNELVNNQLLYQVLSSRIWGRTGFYQPSGAYGYRDQLQDAMSLVWSKPEITKALILQAASHQFTSGDVQHWWHPPGNSGTRSESSDDLLWLVFVTLHYLKVTNDLDILDEKAAYLDPEGYKSGDYFTPKTSHQATIYEHCIAAIERTLGLKGKHGLPLMLAGDWNDSMSNVGRNGKGESIWLAIFLSTILEGFSRICQIKNDKERAGFYQRSARELAQTVERVGWDGKWFLRAYFDDGSKLGSSQNSECQIDSLPQSWSVISGLIDHEKAQEAMQAVKEHLVDEANELIYLLTPPFVKSQPDPGYIKLYPPGVRENGGHYNHAALWVIQALAQIGEGDTAMHFLNMINPFHRSRNQREATRYAVEPYVVASDIYSHHPFIGRGGWTWYTGSAGLMYKIVIEDILGLHFHGSILNCEPCIPVDWGSFSVKFRYGKTTYNLTVSNPDRVNKGVKEVTLDGKRVDQGKIQLNDDQKTHQIELCLGPS